MAEIKPTVISTFAGCGGSSLGYHLAGFKELLAVEWDDNAAATFKLNFPDVPLYHGDIAKLSVEECLARSGLRVGQLDVFDGSPPCQGFSVAGNRKFSDPRNGLFKEYARLLTGLQPKVFVMENVTGMIKGAMKQAYLKIISELRGCGYQAQGQVMNAMYYNVPQSRERVIIIGVRNDLGLQPSHPKPQLKPVSVGEAIKNAPTDGLNGKYLELTGKTSELIKILKPGQRMDNLYEQVHGKGKRAYFAFSRTHPDKPSNTITKDSCGLIHFKENRTLTVGELKLVGSFSHNFKFIGTYLSANQRIGNSVPPNLMKAIALHIKQEILAKSM